MRRKMTDFNAQMKASLNVLADRAGMNHKELSKKATGTAGQRA